MRAGRSNFVLVLSMMLAVSACASREARILEADGPDEFAVLPGKPLQSPNNYSVLPDPTPGASNISDPTPRRDAIAALGGKALVNSQPGIPTTDGALIAYTSRYGVENWVRGIRKFTRRLFGFRGQSLDPYRELERLRTAGVKTPSAPSRADR